MDSGDDNQEYVASNPSDGLPMDDEGAGDVEVEAERKRLKKLSKKERKEEKKHKKDKKDKKHKKDKKKKSKHHDLDEPMHAEPTE